MFLESIIKAGITHSCYPNTGLSFNNELITIKDMNAGEPITIDFSTLFLGGKVLMTCHCGFNGCRGMIRGFDQIPVIVQEKYLEKGVVPVFTELSIKS